MLDNKDQTYINPDISRLVPVVCHYDSSTLMTRSGDLIKTIRLNGFEINDELFGKDELIDVLRKSLKTHVKSSEYAVYIHIINDSQDVTLDSSFSSDTALKIEQNWNRSNNWSAQDVSTLYVTIVSRGMRESAFNPKVALRSLSPSILQNNYLSNSAKRSDELDKIVADIVKDLNRFGAKLLDVKKSEKTYISEPFSFIHKLLHLRTKNICPSFSDFSQQVSDLDIDYFLSSMQIMDYNPVDGKKGGLWAAVYSVKLPSELGHDGYTKLLEFGGKYIISEVVVFAPAQIALKDARYHKKINDISRDDEVLKFSGIGDLIKSDTMSQTDFCECQITITVYECDQELFVKRTRELARIAQEIGLILVREDFSAPKCFMSQIPGNFEYITRKQYNASKRIGSFVHVAGKKNGSYHGSHWGGPISIFKTANNAPYYFNFHDILHDPKNGNTIVFGGDKSIKEKLIGFLVAQSLRINPKIINISLDSDENSFFDRIGAKSIEIGSAEQGGTKLVDLLDPGYFENNAELFIEVLVNLILGNGKLNNRCHNMMVEALSKIQSMQKQEEKVKFLQDLAASDNELQEAIKIFLKQSERLCAAAGDLTVAASNPVLNLFFSKCASERGNMTYLLDIIALLLLRIAKSLDGQPSIISFANFGAIFSSKVINALLTPILKFASEKNAIVLFGAKYNEGLYTSSCFAENYEYFATRLFTSNRAIDNLARKSFKMTNDELYSIKSSGNKKNLVLLKQHSSTLNIRFDLDDDLDDVISLL